MKQNIINALKSGLPISIGYFPAAIAFGILAKSCGTSLFECFLFSSVVFAGASQFIALNLFVTGMGPGGIILTTLLVNFRHFLMSASLSKKLGRLPTRYLVPMAFGVTDEVFSVLSFSPEKLSPLFVYLVELCAYSAWVAGSLAGFELGGFLPEILSKSMGVALYALLLAILIPEAKKSVKAFILVIASGALNSFLIHLNIIPKSWTIIICILLVASIGSFFIDDFNKEQKK